jgi:hypothetical protein
MDLLKSVDKMAGAEKKDGSHYDNSETVHIEINEPRILLQLINKACATKSNNAVASMPKGHKKS